MKKYINIKKYKKYNMDKKEMSIMNIKLIMIFVFIMISFVQVNAAQQTLGRFITDDPVTLLASCSNSTYANLSYVAYPNKSFAKLGNFAMTSNGDTYYLNYTDISSVNGQWIYCYHCDLNGVDGTYCADYIVQPTADENNIGFYIMITIIIIGGLLIGIFIRNIPVTLIGSLCSVAWGLYTAFLGFDNIKNLGTEILSIAIIAFGFYWGFKAMMDNLELF